MRLGHDSTEGQGKLGREEANLLVGAGVHPRIAQELLRQPQARRRWKSIAT